METPAVDTRRNKPVLAVDIDGVILNFTGPFSCWYNQHDDYPNYIPNNPKVWSYGTVDNETLAAAVAEFLGQDPYPTLPLVHRDIPHYLERLRKWYKVVIVTSRKPEWVVEGVKNLEGCGVFRDICYDDIVFTGGDKRPTLKRINAIGLIDDKPLTAIHAANMGITVFMPMRWNYVREFRDQHTDLRIFFYDSWNDLYHDRLNL